MRANLKFLVKNLPPECGEQKFSNGVGVYGDKWGWQKPPHKNHLPFLVGIKLLVPSFVERYQNKRTKQKNSNAFIKEDVCREISGWNFFRFYSFL